MVEDIILPLDHCPECGHALAAVTDPIGEAKPAPGDFTICISCISVLCFTDDMKLRTTTLAERAELPDHAFVVMQALAAMKGGT